MRTLGKLQILKMSKNRLFEIDSTKFKRENINFSLKKIILIGIGQRMECRYFLCLHMCRNRFLNLTQIKI